MLKGNVTVNYNATSVNITWNPLYVLDWNGPPLHYKLSLNESQLDKSVITKYYFVDYLLEAYHFYTLLPFTEYCVSVAACTTVGCAEFTTTCFLTLQAGE